MDTAKINTIDETQEANGYVLVDTTITVDSIPYEQIFTVNATDAVSVVNSVKVQAEAYRQQVVTSQVLVPTITESTELSSLDGTVISL